MGEDVELEAIHTVLAALSSLDAEAQARVLGYAAQRLGTRSASSENLFRGDGHSEDEATGGGANGAEGFDSFADLYDRARPGTDAHRALVGGYWLQVSGGAADFEALYVNKELANLGHRVGNVTIAFRRLSNQKPVLAMQVRKSGKSAQARKRYKLTEAGIKAVEGMIKKDKD